MTERKSGTKDEILARSPLLKSFIDEYGKVEPDMWKRMVGKVFVSKKEEVILVLGEEKIEKDIRTLLAVAEESRVFNTDITTDTKVALIFCFAWMGYEVGNHTEVGLFYDDILKSVFVFDAFDENEESKTFIRGAVDSGVFWREDIDRETEDVFKTFFKKINFP